jgi:2-iminobutanoate/2-iminopropanoate deaminase
VLKAGGMSYRNIVKVTVFLTDSRFVGPYRTVRDRFIKNAPYPASTLLVVQGLADPAMLVEVEVVAAK